MTNIAYNVFVLTVTYGNRWDFLKQVLIRVLSFHEVKEVVVVDNGSTYAIDEQMHQLQNKGLTLLKMGENLGSAGGYKKGLEYILAKNTCDFIWLLDDDNLPDIDALQNLLQIWPTIPLSENKKALYSLRLDRLHHIQVAQGTDPKQFYLVPDNFMGFHFLRIFHNQYRKLIHHFTKSTPLLQAAKLPYVPYGGLFMHNSLLKQIGVPDERFFTYVDDSAYTYRITQQGGEIWLIPSSKIRDVDTSQGINYKKYPWRSAVLDLWNFRTYYQVRNRIYFYSQHAIKNKLIFNLNKCFFLNWQYFISLITRKQVAYRSLKEAIQDGLSGNLGKKENKPIK